MPQENLAGRTIATYRLLERVGEGGTATVYRADHPEHGRVAVKILRERLRADPTAIKRFLREAGYHSRVVHPSVVRTFDYGEVDGLHYLALEWVDGEPLSKFVQRSGRLSPSLSAHIVSGLSEGIDAAHAVGIIHRDLKPENIVYNPSTREVKLLDFGIARDAELDAAERLTRTGFFVGTLHYVAPEALSGELVEEAADIYSVATIAYYLLTGRHPYSGRSPRELFQQLLTQDPTALNAAVPGLTFPRALERAVMRGLSRNPADRQQSVTELARQISLGAEGAPESPAEAGDGGRGFLGGIKSMFRRNREENY
ncbi:MAG: serine/threonine protein kinase [Gemmatimonadota bacterium]|nr:MAG: serine/threonine protein kinase [Gemmatimonadota bacterium]